MPEGGGYAIAQESMENFPLTPVTFIVLKLQFDSFFPHKPKKPLETDTKK
jgi:hypothetical protein